MAKKEKSQAAEKVAKAEKASKSPKPKSGKENIFARFGKGIAKFGKDFKGEIKKIVWPDRKTVLKSTGVVLLVVAIIGGIIFLIDTGLAESIRLLKNAAENFNSETTTAVTEIATAVETTLAQTTSEALTTTEQVTAAVTEAVSTTLGG